jgi:prophage regulatory protein
MGGTVKPKRIEINTQRIHRRRVTQNQDSTAPIATLDPTQTPTTPLPVPAPSRLIRFPSVHDRTGLSRSTVWRLERKGAFPRHRRISPNAVGWLEQEIEEWIQTRTRAA